MLPMRTVMSPAEHVLQTRNPATSPNYSKSAGDGPTTEVDELKKNFRAVQEENYKLQAVITDVTEVNKRWQKYNNDRQMYVQRLLSTIQDQQEQMNKIVETRAFPSLQQVAPHDKNENLETVNAENMRLKEDLAKLRKRLEQLEQEHREHVEVLEFQVKAHRDDWEAERSEKQQALQDKAALELRVKELHKDIRSLKLKLKDERAHRQHSHCMHCCGMHACETNSCGAGMDSRHCQRENQKTYRTSVHLPCASGHLLSRGTTLYFGDEVTDGDEGIVDDLDKPAVSVNRSLSAEDSQCSPPLLPKDNTEEGIVHLTESDNNNNQSDKIKDYQLERLKKKDKKLELNIPPEDSLGSQYKCSILHISPTSSGSNLTADDVQALPTGGVTIGFSSNGLASVTSFSQRPVVKSSSLPISEMISFDSDSSVKPTASQWALNSGWSTVVGPPSSDIFSKDIYEDKKSFNMLSSGNLTRSEGNVTATNVRKAAVPWKAKYFEEGVATQTREDIICPGCGQVFPPRLHLKFLDHFEICQKSGKDMPKRNSNSAAMKLQK